MDSKTTKPNPFDVMKKMAIDGNPKLRLARLSNIVAVDQKGKRCTITIGVGAEDVKNQMLGKIGYGGLFLIDTEEFERTEKEMMAESDGGMKAIVDWVEQHQRAKDGENDTYEAGFAKAAAKIINIYNKAVAQAKVFDDKLAKLKAHNLEEYIRLFGNRND